MSCMYKITFSINLLFLSFCILSCGDDDKLTKNEVSKVNDSTASSTVIKTIVFFGNSLTAGYGLDPAQAFPALIQKKIDSLNLSYKVINAGVSGETSSGGNSRVDWILEQPVDVFVLELGANDGLRGIPITETKTNLQSIINKVKAKYPQAKIVIAGMQMPPNMGQQYTSDFRGIFGELARKNNSSLIPFILEGVGGEAGLNQGDGIHPTTEGHQLVAENVWQELQPLLQ